MKWHVLRRLLPPPKPGTLRWGPARRRLFQSMVRPSIMVLIIAAIVVAALVQGALRPLQTEPGLLPATEALRSLWLVATVVSVLGAALLAVTLWMSTAWLIVPLEEVRRAAKRALQVHDHAHDHGDDEATEKHDRLRLTPEFNPVSSAFNDMLAAMEERYQQLEVETRRLQAVLQGTTNGVVLLGNTGRISLINPRAQVLFGVDTEAVGKHHLTVLRQPDLEEAITEAGHRSQPVRLTILLHDSGGAAAHELEAMVIPLTRRQALAGRAGRDIPAGTLLLFTDMTRERRLSEMRRDFVANVSHELQSPLTAIIGFSETLLGGQVAADTEAARFTTIIRDESQRMSRLVDDLLELSRIESGQAPPQLEPVALRSAASGVISRLQPLWTSAQLDVQNEVAPDLPPLRADPALLDRVLQNLLSNSIKYTPQGGSVQITARHLANGKAGKVELAVADSGVGVPSEHLPRLFERFYRVDQARSRHTGGTGLGLAIVKHIVAVHGGEVAIRSEPGQGTVVRVAWPVWQESTGDDQTLRPLDR